jgi:hypothetical protein
MAEDRQRRTLYALTFLAAVMALGHHVDHIIRGNNVGWPVSSQVNAFTYSLAVYPVIATGLLLYRARRVGPGFWAFISGGGALFLAFIHFAPGAIEPPVEIIDLYEPRALGWFAFAWLVGLIGVLVITCIYEMRSWMRIRRR